MKTLAALLVLFAAPAFGQGVFPEARVYQHEVVSPEECERLRAEDPIFACTAELELDPNGAARLRVTDIIYLGRYGLTRGTLYFFAPQERSAFPRIAFRMSDDESELRDDRFGWTWKRLSR